MFETSFLAFCALHTSQMYISCGSKLSAKKLRPDGWWLFGTRHQLFRPNIHVLVALSA
jgi:hypothetical protein